MRMTSREAGSTELPPETLSTLLWAAFGINRESAAFSRPGRTAPSASNSQETDLYVVMKRGAYLYRPEADGLEPVMQGDFRRMTVCNGSHRAPVHIVYVADLSRYDLGPGQPDPDIGDPEVQKSYYFVDAGFIAQNVHLFAASEGLAAWFHNCDRQGLAEALHLRPCQLVLFAQSVGYPARAVGSGRGGSPGRAGSGSVQDGVMPL